MRTFVNFSRQSIIYDSTYIYIYYMLWSFYKKHVVRIPVTVHKNFNVN